MEYTLPNLPYAYEALEPVLSKQIMTLHHTKHHAAYVANLNAALKRYKEAEEKGDLEGIAKELAAIKFNGGGHINHTLFWESLSPVGKGGQPSAALKKELEALCGSFEKFIDCFNKKGLAVQGSGWVWLGVSPCSGRVRIVTTANQDPLAVDGPTPILGIDVWEHAYYPQYLNARADYLKNIWQIINWEVVNQRFEAIKKSCTL